MRVGMMLVLLLLLQQDLHTLSKKRRTKIHDKAGPCANFAEVRACS